jgi:hypothetical protein
MIEGRKGTWGFRLSGFALLILACISLFPATSFGQTLDIWINAPEAKWEDSNFWTGGVPNAGSIVLVPAEQLAMTGYGCTIDAATGSATALDLYVRAINAIPAGYTLSVLGGTLTDSNLYIFAGQDRTPVMYQAAGTVNVLNNLVLGRPDMPQANSRGTYTMDGGSLVVDGNEIIGMNADETCSYLFDARSSAYKFNWVKGDLQLGYNPTVEANSGARYLMNNGDLRVGGDISIGGSSEVFGAGAQFRLTDSTCTMVGDGNFIVWAQSEAVFTDSSLLRIPSDPGITDPNMNFRSDGQLRFTSGIYSIGDVFRQNPSITSIGDLFYWDWVYVLPGVSLTVSRMRQEVAWVEGLLVFTGDSNIELAIGSQTYSRAATVIGPQAHVRVINYLGNGFYHPEQQRVLHAIQLANLIVVGTVESNANLYLGLQIWNQPPQYVYNLGKVVVRGDEFVGFQTSGSFIQSYLGDPNVLVRTSWDVNIPQSYFYDANSLLWHAYDANALQRYLEDPAVLLAIRSSSHTVTGSLCVGYSGGSNGVFTLGAGVVTVDGSRVTDWDPDGNFLPAGPGISGSLYLGFSEGSVGTFNMTGGTLNVAGNIYVGGSTSRGGTGALTMDGGYFKDSDAIDTSPLVWHAGTLNIEGNMQIWEAGAVNLGDVKISCTGPDSNVYILSDGNVNVTSGRHVLGSISWMNEGTGAVSVTHGANLSVFQIRQGTITVDGNLEIRGEGKVSTWGALTVGQNGILYLNGVGCVSDPTLNVTNDGNLYVGTGASAVLGTVANADSNFLRGMVFVEPGANLTVNGLNQATVTVAAGAVLSLGGPGSSGYSMQTLQGSTTLQSVQTPTISHAQWLVNRRCLVFKDSNVAEQLGMDRWVNDYQIAHGLPTGIGIVMESVLGYTSFGRFTGLDGNDVLERFTSYGDCNLDGAVDAADYAMFAIGLANQANFGTSAYDPNQSGWAYGDFNYDGVVDATDAAIMEVGYEGYLASLDTSAMLTVAPGVVPEPGTIALMLLGGLALLKRRRG